MFKFGKFDKQLIAAFCLGVGVIVASNAIAGPGWYSKPVQCATVDEVVELLDERDQVPLFAGVGAVRIENDPFVMPFVIFSGQYDTSWHVVEFNVPEDQACIVALGDQIDFEAADWYDEAFKGLQY